MKCMECGAETETRRESYRYTESGLSNVILEGVEVSRCPRCGDVEVAIPNVEGLHREIAFALTHKRARLASEEIRYLRKYLGWSQADFARRMGTASETVSRWENGAQPMNGQADRLLRLMVWTREPETDYSLESLAAIDEESVPTPTRFGLSVGALGWQAALV